MFKENTYYRHKFGNRVHTLTKIKTALYGTRLLAEYISVKGISGIIPLEDNEDTELYKEISEKEFKQ
jgi:hypothetical protein